MIKAHLGDLSGPFWSTVIGAVVGAVVAGLISLANQTLAARIAREEVRRRRREDDLATAYGLSVKVIRILSTFHQVNDEVDDARKRAVDRPGGFAWEVMPAFGPLPPAVSFSAQETAFALSTRVPALMLSVLELEDVHRTLLGWLDAYSRRREDLSARLPMATFEGRMASVELKSEEARALGPFIAPLEGLARAILDGAAGYVDEGTRVFDLLTAHCRGRFHPDFPPLIIDRPRRERSPTAP